jgi:hypothetical protein
VDAFTAPLLDRFRQGEAPPDVRLMAARGGLLLRPEAQLSLLMLLASDEVPEVAAAARRTISRLPAEPLAALLAHSDTPAELRAFFASIGSGEAPDRAPAEEEIAGEALLGAGGESPADPPARIEVADPEAIRSEAEEIEATPERRGTAQRLSMLTVSDRMKAAVLGSREERSILVRDPNRLVSSAVLSSPRLTESEVESIARMTNVSGDVLRAVGTNRVWLKNYAVMAALARNAKTPIAVSLSLLNRLLERDIKFLASDRNIPEPVRLAARKIYTQNVSRRR